MNKTLLFGVILMVILSAIAIINGEYVTNEQKGKVTSLVDSAVSEIESNGESVFPEFYNANWYNGDSYVFVWRMDGVRVVYPPDPSDVVMTCQILKMQMVNPSASFSYKLQKMVEAGWNINGQNQDPKCPVPN